jgi:hypothetical protein
LSSPIQVGAEMMLNYVKLRYNDAIIGYAVKIRNPSRNGDMYRNPSIASRRAIVDRFGGDAVRAMVAMRASLGVRIAGGR